MPYLRIIQGHLHLRHNHRLLGGCGGAGGGTYSGRCGGRCCCCRRRCCCRQLNDNFEFLGSFVSAPSASSLSKQESWLISTQVVKTPLKYEIRLKMKFKLRFLLRKWQISHLDIGFKVALPLSIILSSSSSHSQAALIVVVLPLEKFQNVNQKLKLWFLGKFSSIQLFTKGSHLKFDPALVVVALAHGDVVGGSLPLDLAHLLRMLECAPLQKKWVSVLDLKESKEKIKRDERLRY